MKQTLFLLLLTICSLLSLGQGKPSLQKSWIRLKTENLSDRELDPDTAYTRYTFSKSEVRLSFYPAWDDYKQPCLLNNKDLTIGFDTCKIEELTDSSLTFSLDGFRRFTFLSEDYLSSKEWHLQAIGEYHGKLLYKANHFISPRYKKEGFSKEVQKDLDIYRDKKAAYFSATFVITTEGKVENVQIINGLSEGFNNKITKEFLATSKQWKPAYYKGQPIQTQLLYEIKYLKSTIPYNSGRLD